LPSAFWDFPGFFVFWWTWPCSRPGPFSDRRDVVIILMTLELSCPKRKPNLESVI
jgi:hypothetical protein